MFIKQGGVSHTEYNVKVNNTLAKFDTSSSTTSSTEIAAGLKTDLDSKFPATEKYVTGVTVGNPTTNGPLRNAYYRWRRMDDRYRSYLTDYKVEVAMEQTGKGTGAKGEAVIENGKITSVNITHPGSGYDSDVTTYPVTVTFTEMVLLRRRHRQVGFRLL